MMNACRTCVAVASSLLCWLCAGCSTVERAAQHSDGFFDFVYALASHPRRDVVPVERISGRSGEIVSAHAEIDHRGGTYVSGILHQGFGYEGEYDAHVDVKVFGTDRRLIAALATDFFPRPIPNSYHGTIGRAWFSVRLPFVPNPGSTIQVIYSPVALPRESHCERTTAGVPRAAMEGRTANGAGDVAAK